MTALLRKLFIVMLLTLKTVKGFTQNGWAPRIPFRVKKIFFRFQLFATENIADFPFYNITVDEHQEVYPQDETLKAWVDRQKPALKDIWVVSHGWRTEPENALEFYKEFFKNIRQRLVENEINPDEIGVVGVFWPSVRENASRKEVIKVIHEDFPELPVYSLDNVESGGAEEKAFLSELFKKLSDDAEEPAFNAFVLEKLSEEEPLPGLLEEERFLTSLITFPIMKRRAYLTGMNAVSPVLHEVMGKESRLRLHLVGHSFGGVLVASVANATSANGSAYASMTLLQAAFSHNAFAAPEQLPPPLEGRGRFRSVVENGAITGPFVATHSKKDSAVGTLYERIPERWKDDEVIPKMMAERKVNPFGAIGKNGILWLRQHETAEAIIANKTLNPVEFQNRKVTNVNADGIISSHNDVWNPHVANLAVHTVNSAR